MDKLYTINEVADKLNLSDKTLRRWEEAGRFHSTRTLGNQRRYTLEDLQILDAIKHGTIEGQDDLLNINQAAKLCGVSPVTIGRWENAGKIHPFITSGNTYYPRHKLIEKMDELKYENPLESPAPTFEPAPSYAQAPLLRPTPQPTPSPAPNIQPTPRLTPLTPPSPRREIFSSPLKPYAINLAITLTVLLVYHFLMQKNAGPLSPQSLAPAGVVQGVSTIADPRLDTLEQKLKDHLAEDMLYKAKVLPSTTINLTGAALVAKSATLGKGKDQMTIQSPTITETSVVNVSFTADYAPAKKYWLTLARGSFTLHTDFPVGADTPFTYLLLDSQTPTATSSATGR